MKKTKKYLLALTLVLLLGLLPLFGLQVSATEFSTPPMLAAGGAHSLALASDGTVWAWGYNGYGQLGDGTTEDSATPIQVPDLSEVIAIVAGDCHSLALQEDGTVWAWGDNLHGQLGNGTSGSETYGANPTQVLDLDEVTAIAAGGYYSLALKEDGTVWAWGWNASGLLDDGSGINLDSYTPTQVQFLDEVTAIAAGTTHALALRSDGTVWAWGGNYYSQAGNNADGTFCRIPVQIDGLSDVVAITAGALYSLALQADGTVWAWGVNSCGQLGGGMAGKPAAIPVQVPDLDEVTAITAGSDHALALQEDGTVLAWGDCFWGLLGDKAVAGENIPGPSPVKEPDLSDLAALSAGGGQTLALFHDGTVWAWGWNRYGQLGNGIAVEREDADPTPTQVLGENGEGFLELGVYKPTLEIPPTSLTLSQVFVPMIPEETLRLIATRDIATETAPISWESSEPAVVSVDDAGLITAVADGKAVITVVCGDFSADCYVTVESPSSSRISAWNRLLFALGNAFLV